ncbi:hypothetical protein [Candidatus Mycobacterium methanotrophicum]|uniref:Uncharacterized protein n=1 Tax=Candidatus Mycobacterium methanotrophicum TaxID=2943498 RepID=A0ABY4QG79_9MYCO|nr:hypothetical protein [Candidatus Mycobacterium methanotrophicum]UQX09973.1 hypothetical protein M5I08_17310 [Candidatus Mycobacterium methanotrophicum]
MTGSGVRAGRLNPWQVDGVDARIDQPPQRGSGTHATAVSQDAQGDHRWAASLAREAILAALDRHSAGLNAG